MHHKYRGWFAVMFVTFGVMVVFSMLGDGGITGAVVGNFDGEVGKSVSVSSCGTISSDIIFSSNITATGDCFTIESDDIVIDGAGYSLFGDNRGTAFVLGGYENSTIHNFTEIIGFTNGATGINLSEISILNVDLYNVSEGDDVFI